MAVSREKKEQMVADYVDNFSRSSAIFLTDYRGLSVSQMESLRARIREAGGGYSIVKNTLAARALEAANLPVSENMLIGPTAISFAGGPWKHQFSTSMLWMCCSQIWSPESQVKWYQL